MSMSNETCPVCMHPKRLEIENILLTGNVTPKFVAKTLMLNDSIYVEETDIAYHIENCLHGVKTQSAAHKTLRDMKDNAVSLQAAKEAYQKAEIARQCVPYGQPDADVVRTHSETNKAYLDLKEKGRQLNIRYNFQIASIASQKRLRESLASITATDAKRKAEAEIRDLALRYQAEQQRKAEAGA